MFGCDGEPSPGLGVRCCGKDEGYHRGNDWTKRSSPAGLISRFASFHAVRAAICISSVIRTWVVLIFNSMVRVCVGSSDCTLLRAGTRSVYLLIHNGKRPSSGSSPRAASPTVSGTSRTLRINVTLSAAHHYRTQRLGPALLRSPKKLLHFRRAPVGAGNGGHLEFAHHSDREVTARSSKSRSPSRRCARW